jgi:hypothetical protein
MRKSFRGSLQGFRCVVYLAQELKTMAFPSSLRGDLLLLETNWIKIVLALTIFQLKSLGMFKPFVVIVSNSKNEIALRKVYQKKPSLI